MVKYFFVAERVYQEKESKGGFWRWVGIFVTAGIVLGVVLNAVDLEIGTKT